VLTHRQTALLVPPGDERGLGSALVELRENPQTAASLARNASTLSSRYSWDARAERLEAALEAALAS
jgi:glycosyltransferase involved in cell wall biosynthesis